MDGVETRRRLERAAEAAKDCWPWVPASTVEELTGMSGERTMRQVARALGCTHELADRFVTELASLTDGARAVDDLKARFGVAYMRAIERVRHADFDPHRLDDAAQQELRELGQEIATWL